MGTLSETKENEKVCFYCGKPYVLKRFEFTGNGALKNVLIQRFGESAIYQYCADCDCERNAWYEQKAKEEAKERQELLNKRFENSMMSPLFREKRFENLNPCEHLAFCRRYAQKFKPKYSQGLCLIGETGTGKTTLLAAICNELIEKGYTCLFMTFSGLIENLLTYSAENSGNLSDRLEWLRSFDFVVLDDIGRESYNTERRNEIAFRIIDTLLNYKVVTSISGNPEMISRLKDVWQQNAAVDRLRQMCPINLSFNGESYRGKNQFGFNDN